MATPTSAETVSLLLERMTDLFAESQAPPECAEAACEAWLKIRRERLTAEELEQFIEAKFVA